LVAHQKVIGEAAEERANVRTRVLLLAGLLLMAMSTSVFALEGDGHKLVTQKALGILQTTDNALYARFLTYRGRCPEMPTTAFRNPAVPALISAYYAWPANTKLVGEAPAVDDYRDLEFVDVEGGIGSGGRDNPHKDEWDAIDDEAHYSEEGSPLTAFDHFIDIKKGSGLFDDYDGYAYQKGSASRGQYQQASDATSGWLATLLAKVTRFKVDEGLNWWFNDEYIHALGQSWYRSCSPAVERYSFPGDKGRYSSVQNELVARFPVANSTGSSGKGIPYSVFMPIDNMARYWYGRFEATRDPAALGPVIHAIQDASVPHHAAGYNGNWHSRYENDLNSRIPDWLIDTGFENDVKALVASWSRNDPSPPSSLAVGDWRKEPAVNWPISQLVTWVALNAYREYSGTYNHFRNGYRLDTSSAKNLTKLTTAMSVLVLKKACGFSPRPGLKPIGPVKPLKPARPTVTTALKEDCISFDYRTAEVKQVGGRWKIVAGNSLLKDFGNNEGEARRALQIIKHYRMNSQCFVGRPGPSMEYYLADGKAPTGSVSGQDCLRFDPDAIEVKRVGAGWKIVQGSRWLMDFGAKEDEARTAFRIIKKHGFTYTCYVGRPDPSMTYFRK